MNGCKPAAVFWRVGKAGQSRASKHTKYASYSTILRLLIFPNYQKFLFDLLSMMI